MSAPNTNIPGPHILHPLFGTYCSTESFSVRNFKGGSQHQHFEAYLDDPVKKTWTVSKVVTTTQSGFNPYREKNSTTTSLVKGKVNFKEALELLGTNEKDCRDKPLAYDKLYPDAPMMRFVHYKAFAEREGYVYDTNGKPHARPNERVLPLGCTFYQSDVDSANQNNERPAAEFDNNGPASKLPNSHFLLDRFNTAAHKNDYQTSVNGLRALSILDHFVDQIEQTQKHLDEYCEKYSQMGFGGLIDDADTTLRLAESSLKQLRAYGVDTTEYDRFVLQCRVAAYVLHAEGLYDLMNKGKGDYAANEALFQSRVTQALDNFKKIDSSESAHRTLENMIVQTPKPEAPAAIGDFVKQYRRQRAGYGDPAPAAAPPKPPKP